VLLRAEPGKRHQFCVAELGSGRKEKMRGEKRRSIALAFLPPFAPKIPAILLHWVIAKQSRSVAERIVHLQTSIFSRELQYP
jgi:hypothetical protein